MNRVTYALTAAALITAGTVTVAQAADPDTCVISHTEPVSRSTVTWDADKPRRLVTSTELGERQFWVDQCAPTAIEWLGVFLAPRTYRLRASVTVVPVGSVIEGWPEF